MDNTSNNTFNFGHSSTNETARAWLYYQLKRGARALLGTAGCFRASLAFPAQRLLVPNVLCLLYNELPAVGEQHMIYYFDCLGPFLPPQGLQSPSLAQHVCLARISGTS